MIRPFIGWHKPISAIPVILILILRNAVGVGQAGNIFAMKKSVHSRLSHPILAGLCETARRLGYQFGPIGTRAVPPLRKFDFKLRIAVAIRRWLSNLFEEVFYSSRQFPTSGNLL